MIGEKYLIMKDKFHLETWFHFGSIVASDFVNFVRFFPLNIPLH